MSTVDTPKKAQAPIGPRQGLESFGAHFGLRCPPSDKTTNQEELEKEKKKKKKERHPSNSLPQTPSAALACFAVFLFFIVLFVFVLSGGKRKGGSLGVNQSRNMVFFMDRHYVNQVGNNREEEQPWC